MAKKISKAAEAAANVDETAAAAAKDVKPAEGAAVSGAVAKQKPAEQPKVESFKAEGKTFTIEQIKTALTELGGKDLKTPDVRKKLGLESNGPVRRIMEQLAEKGIVKLEKKSAEGQQRETFVYNLA